MRYLLTLPLALFMVACGSSPSSPSGPSSQSSGPVTVSGTLTDTATGQPIGSFSQTVNDLPAQVTLEHPGYVTRQTWLESAAPRVDLFPEAGFDLGLYRQLARGELEGGSLLPLRVLTQAPAFYLQTAGLSAANVAALEAAARAATPAFTGGQFQVTTWETGAEARTPRAGWISAEQTTDPAATCGLALIGASAGRITLSTLAGCGDGTHTSAPGVFVHEIGHALGFFHVASPGAIMLPLVSRGSTLPSDRERQHAAFAYARLPGNTDIDSDPRRPVSAQTAVLVVD